LREVPHFKLTVAYDGTAFVGWQRQETGPSIQGVLEEALAVLEGGPVTVIGAGRTDAGVHALGQVASVTLTRAIDGDTVRRAVNFRLPETVRVLDVMDVPATFQPQFHARSKTYAYRIWNGEVLHPFVRGMAWHIVPPPLDVDAMRRAAALLAGRHDFAAFQGSPPIARTTERDIFASAVTCGGAHVMPGVDPAAAGHAGEDDGRGPLITYEVRGEGFLRHMVRTIAGTLVEIGRRRYPPEWVSEVIASRSRAAAGPTAPAHGLFLVRVEY
jgi:tRNA pseudouridine38-40 synthase